jgi:hypothetical protein
VILIFFLLMLSSTFSVFIRLGEGNQWCDGMEFELFLSEVMGRGTPPLSNSPVEGICAEKIRGEVETGRRFPVKKSVDWLWRKVWKAKQKQ